MGLSDAPESVGADQRWTVTVIKFDEIKRDKSFCSIVTLGRAVNALHFVHTPLLDNDKDNTPAGMRNRYNSLFFTCALFAEASLLVASMQKHFKQYRSFQELAATTNSKEARHLLKENLFRLRKKLVFHFDAEEVEKQMATLKLDNPIFVTAMGMTKLHAYHELADLVALRTLFGPDVPDAIPGIKPVLQSLSSVVIDFLVAAENFMVDVLTQRGWVQGSALE